jgi:hypothetical protein
LYFTRKLKKINNLSNEIQNTQSTINPPVYVNPVFKIVYEKESLDDEDIDPLVDFVINFSTLSKTKNLTDIVKDTDDNSYYVKYNSIQFNQLIKI